MAVIPLLFSTNKLLFVCMGIKLIIYFVSKMKLFGLVNALLQHDRLVFALPLTFLEGNYNFVYFVF